MSALKFFYNRLSNFFFAPQSLLPLGVYRIAFGSVFFLYILYVTPLYMNYYSVEGYMSNSVASGAVTWDRSTYFDMWPSLYYYFNETQLPLPLLITLILGATVFFTIGLYSNLAALVIYILWYSIAFRNGIPHNGEDGMMRFALFYAIFLPLDARLSLRSYFRRLNKKSLKTTFIPFVLRLFQIHVAIVYLFSLPYKLVDDYAWIDGTALYYTALHTRWGLSPEGVWVATALGGWLVTFMTYWALFCESFFLFFVWFKKTRLVACLLLGQLHLGIALTIEHTTAFNVAALLNILLFLKKEDYVLFIQIARNFYSSLIDSFVQYKSYLKA